MTTDRDGIIQLSVPMARTLCLDIFRQLAVPDCEATQTAAILLEASLRGIDSHGIALLAVFAERIRSGQIHPGRAPFIRREGPTTAWVDGQHGMGPTLAVAAMTLAMDKARRTGLGAVSLYDGNYVGALAGYVEDPARAGYIALAMANATPRVAPHGGGQGLHGTNPIAWAAPAADGEPLLFDAATGHAAARIGQAADDGSTIPAGIALDPDGRPTTDPFAAAKGTLLPVGGALGYGLGLLVDVLTGGLAAAPMGRCVPPVTALDGPYGCSFFALVIDPDRFGGATGLAADVAVLRESARTSTFFNFLDAVRAPGDRAWETRRKRLAEGIPCTHRRWQGLLQRLVACGLNISRAAAIDRST
ncbi:MAG: Ldh family oxidoreductase [bacterium]|nr:Ldh family oxidoreductase [bacterium]